jgi:hypothetical protein
MSIKEHPNTSFDFFGYTFCGRRARTKDGKLWRSFHTAVSRKSQKSFRDRIKALRIHRRTGGNIENIAKELNPIVRGWLNYFSAFYKSGMAYTMGCLNWRLCRWANRKYKAKTTTAWEWIKAKARDRPELFAH